MRETIAFSDRARNLPVTGARGSLRRALIVNADDWGRDGDTTDRISECYARGALSAVSGMVFMEDSERAARLALERQVDVGLHLNLTTRFSGPAVPSKLSLHQEKIAAYLLCRRLSQVIFHPGLTHSFEYVVAAQIDEFRRLYGSDPSRIDGHHHMHLAANVLLQGLLPRGIIVRRNFTFRAGEKSFINRTYRRTVDAWLGRRYQLVDLLFSIEPVADRKRLQKIVELAQDSVVELETHPVNGNEYQFLIRSGLAECSESSPVASSFGSILKGSMNTGVSSEVSRA